MSGDFSGDEPTRTSPWPAGPSNASKCQPSWSDLLLPSSDWATRQHHRALILTSRGSQFWHRYCDKYGMQHSPVESNWQGTKGLCFRSLDSPMWKLYLVHRQAGNNASMPLPLNNVSFQDWGALLTVLRIGAAWPIMRPRNTWNADHTWLFICKYELWRVAGGGSRYIKWMCFPIFSWTSSLRFWHSEAFINFLEPNQSIVPLSDNLLEKFAFELRKLKNKSIKYIFILLHIFSGAWTWLWVDNTNIRTNKLRWA